MARRSVGLASLCGALVLLSPEVGSAQLAHPGYSGLISTPNAEVMPEGRFALGFTWLDGPETYLFAPKTNRIYVATVGILPGLEATLRQTQVIGWYDPEAPGVAHAFDRMFSAKYALPMPTGFPRVAVGIQDLASGNYLAGVRGLKPGATQYGQTTLYGVVGEDYGTWTWHGGLATSQAFIDGPFVGLSVRPLGAIALLGEWDGRGLNWGARVSPLPGWSLQFSSINQTTWGLSSAIQIAL